MPAAVFDAIRGNIETLLGGASVYLEVIEGERGESEIQTIRERFIIDEIAYTFTARRSELPFTRTEVAFCRELMTAFAAMFTGFRQEGYAAHFRTALLASIMDITVARSLRGDRRKGFWPIQQLIQLLKNLSYQRYEGKPATSGFIVHRTTLPELRRLIESRGHTLIPLQPYQSISPNFFNNPLAYRFVDGNSLFFVANVAMQVTGLLRTSSDQVSDDVERLTYRNIFSFIRNAGSGAFAITVNDSSEIEVLLNPDKLLVRRKGVWAVFDPDIFRSFLGGTLDQSAADDLLWTAYALSKIRHGTVILILERGAKHLEGLKKGSVGGDDPVGRLVVSRVKGRKIGELKRAGTLLRILSSDGMTVFNKGGKLVETGFIIDTSHAREVVSGGGRTTAACAASIFGRVIKVSQDGPIELYQDGRQVYRFG
ncbi:hypothetical protein [Geobacter sp. DSM 9736]|uniref:hypothetical protein n=1 Tax=Geobacter sp. DSM 9736 TaxID=1277350 RepID=UPI000B50B580|nr:hypothetical protein [Geobacter sp. DSM 9736]SNB45814.1 hypothetical protein SAMN06269301_1243 [Geobacter sp. DSM 9736]